MADSFTSVQNGPFNDPNTWDVGVGKYPAGQGTDGDDFDVQHDVEVDGDYSVNSCAASSVTSGGLLYWAEDANGKIDMTGAITVDGTSELRMGNAANPIQPGYKVELSLSPAANATIMLVIANGGKLTTNGTATYGMAGEGDEYTYDELTAQAASGQKVISISASKAACLNADDEVWIEGTGAYTQGEVGVVDTVSGGDVTLDVNLTFTHASGARVCFLTRNVRIYSSDPAKQAVIDNNDTETGLTANYNCKLTEFKDISYCYAPVCREYYDYCTMNGSNYGFFYVPTGFTHLTGCVAVDMPRIVIAGKRLVLTGGTFGDTITYCLDAAYAVKAVGAYFSNHPAVSHYAGGDFEQCTFSENYAITRALQDNMFLKNCGGSGNSYIHRDLEGKVWISMRYCDIGYETAEFLNLGNYCRSSVIEQETGQSMGAAKTTQLNIANIEKQSVIARSGDAAEVEPEAQCTSSEPGKITGEIKCLDGDTITVTAWVYVNATYGTDLDNNPTLVLDPNNIYGSYSVSSTHITPAEEWVQITATGTCDIGSGERSSVPWELRVPYYVSGGKVFVDSIEVRRDGLLVEECDCSTWVAGMPALTIPSSETLETLGAKLDTIDGIVDAITAKMPTNYIMGSSDQADHDGDFVSAADVVTALGTGSSLTECHTATGFSTHDAAAVVTALGTGETLTACHTATGFSTAVALASMQTDVTFVKDIEGGRWKIDTTANTMTFYKSDNVTVVATFNLLDGDGAAASSDVMERTRA